MWAHQIRHQLLWVFTVFVPLPRELMGPRDKLRAHWRVWGLACDAASIGALSGACAPSMWPDPPSHCAESVPWCHQLCPSVLQMPRGWSWLHGR